MTPFWQGFEKQAVVGSLARGIGYAVGRGSRALQAARPSALGDAYRAGRAAGVKPPAPNFAKSKFIPSKDAFVAHHTKATQRAAQATPAAKSAPGTLSRARSYGKAAITGGLLGAGGTYMAAGDSGQQGPY